MFGRVSLVVGALALGSSAGAAGSAATGSPKAAKAKDPNEIVCEKQTVPGTRLATKRVCMTRAQWTELRTQDRQDLEKTQMQRAMKAE